MDLDADLAPGLLDQLEDVGLLGLLAGGLDDQLHRPAVGQQPRAVRRALGQADLVEQRVGLVEVEASPSFSRYSGWYSGLCGRTVLLPPMPRPKYRIWLISSRSTASDSARRKRTSRNSSRQTVSLGVEVRVEREMRAARGRPEMRHEAAALLALLEEGVVLEEQAARLEVGLAGAGLDRHQLVVDHVEHHPVDVGQLLTARRRPGGSRGCARTTKRSAGGGVVSCQGCSVGSSGILELVHVVVAAVQLRPVARLGLLDQRRELSADRRSARGTA